MTIWQRLAVAAFAVGIFVAAKYADLQALTVVAGAVFGWAAPSGPMRKATNDAASPPA